MAAASGLSTSGRLFFGSLCVGTFGLGCWQTQRYFEKVVLEEHRRQDLSMEPIALGGNAKGLQRRLVQGRYRHQEEILVGPRGPPPGAMASTGPSSGRSGGGMSSGPQGYYVITPMDDSNSGKTVLMNRGWIPRHFIKEDGTTMDFERPTGKVEVVGVPSPAEQPRFMTPQHDFTKKPLQFFWMDKTAMEQVAGIPEDEGILLTQVKQEQQSSNAAMNQQQSFPAQPPLETVGEYKISPMIHAGYAVTWFGLSGAGIIMTRKLITKGRG